MIDLSGKRVLITQSNDFMGPALCDQLSRFGAEVIADSRLAIRPQDPADIIDAAGPIDALVLNLALPATASAVTDIAEEEWRRLFEVMVDPLPRFLRAVVPGMRTRGGGRIVVMGSASALRGMKRQASWAPRAAL